MAHRIIFLVGTKFYPGHSRQQLGPGEAEHFSLEGHTPSTGHKSCGHRLGQWFSLEMRGHHRPK